jgi:leader peptidase (prepilin peptidase)/N-methyltransferase
VLSAIDLDHQLIPDRVTYPAIPLFFGAALLIGDVAPLDLVLGAVIGYGLVALFAEAAYLVLKREGLGYGDAKLLMLVGVVTGWKGVVASFFGAPFIGLAIVIPILLVRRSKILGVAIPYGPFLAAAAFAYLIFGRMLLP